MQGHVAVAAQRDQVLLGIILGLVFVPTPKRYSRLICSNSSTLRLLSIALPVLGWQGQGRRSLAIYKVGPN